MKTLTKIVEVNSEKPLLQTQSGTVPFPKSIGTHEIITLFLQKKGIR